MFNAWKEEKAIVALIDQAQAMADKLASAKPHVRDGHAAAVFFWDAAYRADGKMLHEIKGWPPAAVVRFVATAQTRIAALRKARDYDSSDGLAIWLHTARAVTEPRITPAVLEIWELILSSGQNADAMAADLMAEAGLPGTPDRRAPTGFAERDAP